MKKFLVLLICVFNLSQPSASERTAFTNIDFGLFLGWGNFIKVENFDHFDSDKTHFLIEVNGLEYKDIIKRTKSMYGDSWKCMLAEHFVETMADLGLVVNDTVDLKLYLFDGGHEVIWKKNIPVTEENLDEIRFETNFCL